MMACNLIELKSRAGERVEGIGGKLLVYVIR